MLENNLFYKLNAQNMRDNFNYFNTQAKIYPRYFNDIFNYPAANPILLAVDWQSLKFIRRLGGVCLLCEKSASLYDLSFCFQREIWVLHSQNKNFNAAMNLGQIIQISGASKILVLLLNTHRS